MKFINSVLFRLGKLRNENIFIVNTYVSLEIDFISLNIADSILIGGINRRGLSFCFPSWPLIG